MPEAAALKKLPGNGDNWNAGAISTQSFQEGEQVTGVEFQCWDPSKSLMFGLNVASSSQHNQDLDFAAYCISDGTFGVYEHGHYKGAYGAYTQSDVIRVAVEADGKVHYSVNGETRYISQQAPKYPLLVDASFHDVGAEVRNVKWAGVAHSSLPKASTSAAMVGQLVDFMELAGLAMPEAAALKKLPGNGDDWNAGAISTQ